MSRLWRVLSLSGLVILALQTAGFAQSINMIEEDWELVLNTPNSARSSPQLTISLSPLADCNSLYATFEINKRSIDEKAGGLQLQMWNGDNLATGGSSVSTFANTNSLYVAGDRVRWTQRMSISNKGLLTIEIVNGTSQTWGNFGGTGDLTVSAASSLNDLNAYDLNASATNSGVDFGGAQVKKLTLRQIRTYTNGKKNVSQSLDRVVYPF